MKTLERYVFRSFLSSFLLAFLVLSFVLTIGLMVQVVGYVLDGVPVSLIGEFAAYSFPETLQWTMPLALLVSSVLVFSRMSADSEIAAMRACGVNVLSVIRWPLCFAALCTLVGMYVNNEIVPRGHEIRRTLKSRVSVGTGLDILEPGRVIDQFPKVKLYFKAKHGDELEDLIVWDQSSEVRRTISAKRAVVTSEGRDIVLELENMVIDPALDTSSTIGRAASYRHVMREALKDSHYLKRDKDFCFREVLDQLDRLQKKIDETDGDSHIKNSPRYGFKCERSTLLTEFSKRFVFAMASICFVLVGIPLGIKAQRRESSIGMAISLVISLGYYLVVFLMLSLHDHFSLHPEVILWLPVVICFALAAWLISRNQ